MPQGKIEKATISALPALFELLHKANEYSILLSIKPAWKDMQKARRSLKEQVKRGNVYIIREGKGSISSSITLCEINDEWGDLGRDNSALYFTKLMKDPDKAQQDEGERLLHYAAKIAKRRKKVFLRCDVLNDPLGIVTYYQKHGFRERGHFIYESSRREGLLLELTLSQL